MKEQEYIGKVEMAYERIMCKEIRSVDEEWKEFRDAVLKKGKRVVEW